MREKCVCVFVREKEVGVKKRARRECELVKEREREGERKKVREGDVMRVQIQAFELTSTALLSDWTPENTQLTNRERRF